MTQFVIVLCETKHLEQKFLLIYFSPLSLQGIFYSAWMFEIFFYFSLTAMTDFSDISIGNTELLGSKAIENNREKKGNEEKVFETVAEPTPEFRR